MSALPAGTVLARLDELADGSAVTVMLNGEQFPPLTGILVRDGASVNAFLNRCPHAGRPLNLGSRSALTPDGELLQCHAHGALFDKHSGLCIAGPCVDESLPRLPVAVVEGEVRLQAPLDTAALLRSPW